MTSKCSILGQTIKIPFITFLFSALSLHLSQFCLFTSWLLWYQALCFAAGLWFFSLDLLCFTADLFKMWVLSYVCDESKEKIARQACRNLASIIIIIIPNLALDFKGFACGVKIEKRCCIYVLLTHFSVFCPFTSFHDASVCCILVCVLICVAFFSGHNVPRHAHNDWLTVIGSHPLNTPPYIENPPPRRHKQHLEKRIKRQICEKKLLELNVWSFHFQLDCSLSFYIFIRCYALCNWIGRKYFIWCGSWESYVKITVTAMK